MALVATSALDPGATEVIIDYNYNVV